MLRDSTVAAVVRTRPRAIPLSMITRRKSIHGFLFPIYGYGAPLGSAITWSMATILRDSVVVVVVVRTRPRAIPLAIITMRKFIDGLPFLFHMSMGLRFGPPELRYHTSRTICYVSKTWGVAHQTNISLGTVVSWRSYCLEI